MAAVVVLPAWLPFDWVLIAVPVLVAGVAVFLPWLRRLPARTRLGLLVGGAVVASGAIVLETVAGAISARLGAGHPASGIVAGLEETAELVGVAILLLTLLRHLLERLADRQVVVTASS